MNRNTKFVAAAIAVVSMLILGTSTLCSWAIAHGASPKWRLAFRMMCHGIESRCLTLFGVPMPICARCTAIYVGLIAGILLFMVLPAIEERAMRVALYVAVAPMAIDGLTQATHLRESTNVLRLITGFIAAVAFSCWALNEVEGTKHTIERSLPS